MRRTHRRSLHERGHADRRYVADALDSFTRASKVLTQNTSAHFAPSSQINKIGQTGQLLCPPSWSPLDLHSLASIGVPDSFIHNSHNTDLSDRANQAVAVLINLQRGVHCPKSTKAPASSWSCHTIQVTDTYLPKDISTTSPVHSETDTAQRISVMRRRPKNSKGDL